MQEKLVIEELDTDEEEADSDSDCCSALANEISYYSSSDPLVLGSFIASGEGTATHIRSFIACGSYVFEKSSTVVAVDSVGSYSCCFELRYYYLVFLDWRLFLLFLFVGPVCY